MTHRAFGIVTFGDHEGGVERPDVAKIEGVVVEVNDRVIIVETEGGRMVRLVVGEETHIQVGDHRGTLDDLQSGTKLQAEFNPETGMAFGIFIRDANVEEPQAKIEGVVVEVSDLGVIVETERGGMVGLIVSERTQIWVGDDQGTLDELQPGTKVLVEFNPETGVAFGIVVLGVIVEEPEVAKIEGFVVEVTDKGVIIEIEGDRLEDLGVNENTQIWVGDDQGTLDDLEPGTRILAEFNPETGMAFTIVILVVRTEEPVAEKVEGVIAEVGEGVIVVETVEGHRVTLLIGGQAHVESRDGLGTVDDLRVGAKVVAEFDSETGEAFVILTLELPAEEPVAEKVDGVIAEVGEGVIVVETVEGHRVTLFIGERTHVESRDGLGTVDDLRVGAKIVAEFDPETGEAFVILIVELPVKEPVAEKVEGDIAEVGEGVIVVETENGRRITLLIGEGTIIESQDGPGTVVEFEVGVRIVAEFDPETGKAFVIVRLEAVALEGSAAR